MTEVVRLNGEEVIVAGNWCKCRITVLESFDGIQGVEWTQTGFSRTAKIGDSFEVIVPPTAMIGTQNGKSV